MLHPVTWVTWTVLVAAAATMTRNPLYLAILLGVVLIQYASVSRQCPEAQGWGLLVRFAAFMSLFVILFNALNAHAGTHVLFRLPGHWPLIGGNITLEAVVYGAVTALSLIVLVLLFAAFNLQIDQAQMMRLTPAFIYEAGLIISIALRFVPQMMLSAREIREAQLIRGHRMRGARDALPLMLALLTTGLERSFQLAESIESRGFGNVRPLPQLQDLLHRVLTLLALAGLLGSAFLLTYYGTSSWAGWAGLGVSTLALLAIFYAQGRRVRRTRYRRERWTWRDTLATGVTAAAFALLLAARFLAPGTLDYYPYASLVPSFDPWLGGVLLLWAVPTVLQTALPPMQTPASSQP